MRDGHTVPKVAVAVASTRRLGPPQQAPELLHERSNVLVRLGSTVASAPATTALVQPDSHD